MGLLRDLQSEIEKRRLPSGGWASGQGRRAAIETTCYGLIALADGQQSVRQNAIDFLLRTKNPDQSWPAFEGDDPEGCWVTAFSLIALKQSLACCRTEQVADRIQLGMEMLRDRACPGGGWNAGNGMVFSAPLKPHIDTTAIALLALTEDDGKPTARRALDWLRQACVECSSAYSLAWS